MELASSSQAVRHCATTIMVRNFGAMSVPFVAQVGVPGKIDVSIEFTSFIQGL